MDKAREAVKLGRFYLVPSVALVVAGSSLTACSDTPPPELEIRRIAHGPLSFSSNSYLLSSGEDALLVDVPEARSDAEHLIEVVRATGLRPRLVFVTHSHPDHFLAMDRIVDAFPGASVVATPKVAERLNTIGPRMVERMGPSLGDEAPGSFVPVAPVDSAALGLGAHEIEVLQFNGGEDVAAAALLLRGQGALIAGDLVYVDAHLYLGNRDIGTWAAQLDSIAALGLTRIYPGHGPPTDLGALDSMRVYFDFFRTAVATGDADSALAFMRERYPSHAAWPLLERFSVPAFVRSSEED